MSNIGLIPEDPRHNRPPSPSSANDPRRRAQSGGAQTSRRGETPKRGRGAKVAAVFVVLALLLGGAAFAVSKFIDSGTAPDFAGPGSGEVSFEVHQGDTLAAMGQGLKAAGVVKSVDAFLAATKAEPDSNGIQVGFYQLKKQMRAKDALAVLMDPKNLIQTRVTVTEGARVRDVIATIVAKTEFKKREVRQALKDPSLGLPADAEGNPEGYLFPATYSVVPGMSVLDLVKQMVEQTKLVENELDIEAKAKELGLTTEQVLTVASILEYEANRSEDYPKVARVLYNRLEEPMRLQLDSTISYIFRKTNSGDVWTTAKMRESTSPYNTYTHDGLPPGPIGSPGRETIEAALNPAKGPWLYFVPDYEHQTTLYTDSYSQHLKNVEKLKVYCQTHDEC